MITIFPPQEPTKTTYEEDSDRAGPLCIEQRDQRGANDGGCTPGPTKGVTAVKGDNQSTNRRVAPDLYQSSPRDLYRRPDPSILSDQVH
jgi:hypothetical protein